MGITAKERGHAWDFGGFHSVDGNACRIVTETRHVVDDAQAGAGRGAGRRRWGAAQLAKIASMRASSSAPSVSLSMVATFSSICATLLAPTSAEVTTGLRNVQASAS